MKIGNLVKDPEDEKYVIMDIKNKVHLKLYGVVTKKRRKESKKEVESWELMQDNVL